MQLLHVADRLAHLRAIEGEHAVVQPEAGKGLAAVRTGGLRDFVFVVREHQVDAARVDVDGVAQVRRRHRRAFDVPARTAASPRAVPAGQLGRRGFP